MNFFKNYKIYFLLMPFLFLVACSSSEEVFSDEYEFKTSKANYTFDSNKDLSIYITTDVHYLSKSLITKGSAFDTYVSSGDGKQLGYITDIFDAFSYDISKNNPDILLISGDLTNNGEKKSHVELSKKLKSIEKQGTSVYVIPGNHDISNPWSRGFNESNQYFAPNIDENDFKNIYKNFGYTEALSKDEQTLSYLATPSEKLWLLMLDTSQYKNNNKFGHPQLDGVINEDTMNWIKDCIKLANDKNATIIPVMHHNSVIHNDIVNRGFTLNNYEELLELFNANNIKLSFSGHMHMQDIKLDSNKSFYDITTTALATYPHNYGVINYFDNSIEYSTSPVSVGEWSKINNIKDKNLNNFEEYSSKFFSRFAENMANGRLLEYHYLSSEDYKSMVDTMKTLYINYFAGLDNIISDEIVNSGGFNLLLDEGDNFLKSFAESMISDRDVDDNKFYLKLD